MGNEFSGQLNPILPASLLSIKEPYLWKQTALLQERVEEIKINASKDAVPFILSELVLKDFPEHATMKRKLHVLPLLTELDDLKIT